MCTDNLEIKAIVKSDYNPLSEFLSNFNNKKTENKKYWIDKLNYWWEQNPAFSESIVRGWVIKKKDSDTILGFIGNIPSYFNLEGKETIVCNATTWRVDLKYRNQSLILLSLSRFCVLCLNTNLGEGISGRFSPKTKGCCCCGLVIVILKIKIL